MYFGKAEKTGVKICRVSPWTSQWSMGNLDLDAHGEVQYADRSQTWVYGQQEEMCPLKCSTVWMVTVSSLSLIQSMVVLGKNEFLRSGVLESTLKHCSQGLLVLLIFLI